MIRETSMYPTCVSSATIQQKSDCSESTYIYKQHNLPTQKDPTHQKGIGFI